MKDPSRSPCHGRFEKTPTNFADSNSAKGGRDVDKLGAGNFAG